MSSVTPILRSFLKVWFEDGDIIYQDYKDQSKKDPKKSFWYDVISDPRNVIKLEIDSEEHWYGVEFLTGKFHVDGKEFEICPSGTPLPPGGIFKPFYCRDNSVKIHQGETTSLSHTHRYRIGWVYVVADKEFTQTLLID